MAPGFHGARQKVALILGGGIGYGTDSTRRMPAFGWLTRELARRLDLTVITWDDELPFANSALDGAGHVNLPPGRGLTARVLTVLHAERPSVVHGYFIHPQGQLAALGGVLLGIPSVVSLGGGELSNLPEIDYGMLRSLAGRLRLRTIAAAATRVTAGSHAMAARGVLIDTEILAIPLGVGEECFGSPRVSAKPPWRLIHVGHLSAIKGTTTLIRALARVVTEEPSVHLDAFGMDLLDGAARRLATELGIAEHITFHGKQPAREVHAYLRRAHLHVLPSLDDSAPVSVLEAAALGVPTVGSRVGHLADWGEARGWAVPPGDAEALAKGVVTLLRDPKRRRTIGEAARTWAREHDAAFTAKRFAELYAALADRRR